MNIKKHPTIWTIPLLFTILIVHGSPRNETLNLNERGWQIDPTSHLTDKEPLLLTRNTAGKHELLNLTPKGYILNRGDPIELYCHGKNNLINGTQEQTLSAICRLNTTLFATNRAYNITTLTCSRRITGEVKKTVEKCRVSNIDGRVYKIGYTINETRSWLPMIDVCYNLMTHEPLYTTHQINGAAIYLNGTLRFSRPSFKPDAVSSRVSIETIYKTAAQKTRLNFLLGSAQQASKYHTKKSFLARGHLTPVGDFPEKSWKATTMYYVNVVPTWQVINSGNWREIEELTRDISYQAQGLTTVITGSSEVMTLPDVNGTLVPLFLGVNDTVPVPKYIWKIVLPPVGFDDRAVGFVCLNDPFVNETRLSVCRDVCKERGLDRKVWSVPSKGLVSCCEVEELVGKLRLDLRWRDWI